MGKDEDILYSKLESHFQDSGRVVETPSYRDFSPTVGSCQRKYFQDRDYHALPKTDRFEIRPENLIGYSHEKAGFMDILEKNALEVGENLYGVKKKNLKFERGWLMTEASNVPLSLDFSLIEQGKRGLSKTCYVKPFGFDRLIGLELYTHLGSLVDADYNFIFNRGAIIEEALDGKHEYQFSDLELTEIKKKTLYNHEKVKENLVALFMGVDDIAKPANYLLTPEGRVRIIDFDLAEIVYSEEDIKNRCAGLQQELGLCNSDYQSIMRIQQDTLRSKVLRNKETLFNLTEIMINTPVEFISPWGRFVADNVKTIINSKNFGGLL